LEVKPKSIGKNTTDFGFLKKMKIKDLEAQMTTLVPVIKISQAMFLIGSEQKQLAIK
jgi:hypothetical protein